MKQEEQKIKGEKPQGASRACLNGPALPQQTQNAPREETRVHSKQRRRTASRPTLDGHTLRLTASACQTTRQHRRKEGEQEEQKRKMENRKGPVVRFDWTLLAQADPNDLLRRQVGTGNKGEELSADLH